MCEFKMLPAHLAGEFAAKNNVRIWLANERLFS
ncbi:hypothetical protein Mal52_24520 [Symmachiella dynata]|uniref:Uncharacterized protein n=1 Tax=Symmachiella dynata TaxID=2527995 RepID=A0A517ZNC1_9PLAN|nr:hypothetical protein Mal52_24520 [Symmachiella dynata]